INLVVHDDVEQVHIAAHRMDEMVAADPKTVAVAARHHYSEFMIGKLQSCGHRQRPAVQSVHAIRIHVPGEVGGTADAADCYDVMVRYAQLDQGFLEPRARQNRRIPDTSRDRLCLSNPPWSVADWHAVSLSPFVSPPQTLL